MFEFLNPFRKSPLEHAIHRGSQPGKNLADEISELSDYKISSRRDAQAICRLLEGIEYAANDERAYKSILHAVTGLFQQVEDFESAGFDVLRQQGIPELRRIAETSLARTDCDEDTLLFVLKILNLYGSEHGARLLVTAARKPVLPESYWWWTTLSAIGDEHPHREFLFRELADPLPDQFIAIALLDAANRLSMEHALHDHPFNSAQGVASLRTWLTADDPDRFSHAVSATAALPFIAPTWRAELLSLAHSHLDGLVRIEAAWSQAKAGDRAGIDQLAQLCLDVNLSQRAQHYLEELGRSDAVPAAALEPNFRAKSDFANWLAHPNELGRAPDELEIVDHRLLPWPPEREPKPFWLIRYRMHDEYGLGGDDLDCDCGVVGSMTFCFFTYKFDQRPPEDCYAIHCTSEMIEPQHLIEELEVTDQSEYSSLLGQWKGATIQSPRIVTVAELSSDLQYSQKLVALASGQVEGQDGWLVLDGPRSTWYPQADFPDSGTYTVLKLHIGRQLLGFTQPVDRKKFLCATTQLDPAHVVTTFERLLLEAESANERRRKKLLADWKSPVFTHFQRYVEAKAAVDHVPESIAILSAYERLLSTTRRAGAEFANQAAGELSSPLCKHFETYIEALAAANRSADVKPIIEFFRPIWDHNLGYGRLGTAAFKIREFDLAEQYLLKLRDGLADYCRSEEMSYLAEIWMLGGKVAEAQDLLIDCLQKLTALVKESKYHSDQEMYEKEFQFHRATFLRLFPDLGEAELAHRAIPATTLP